MPAIIHGCVRTWIYIQPWLDSDVWSGNCLRFRGEGRQWWERTGNTLSSWHNTLSAGICGLSYRGALSTASLHSDGQVPLRVPAAALQSYRVLFTRCIAVSGSSDSLRYSSLSHSCIRGPVIPLLDQSAHYHTLNHSVTRAFICTGGRTSTVQWPNKYIANVTKRTKPPVQHFGYYWLVF